MNQRVQKLKNALRVEKYPLCTQKARLMTESYKQTDGEPTIIRRAKALENILSNINIFIEDGELIVGNAASKPMGVEVTFNTGTWPQNEIDGLKQEGWTITEQDEAEIRMMNEYWKDKTYINRMGQLFDEERLWPFMQSGIYLPAWKTRKQGPGGGNAQAGMGLEPGVGILAVEYEKILYGGVNKMLKEIEEELKHIKFSDADAIKKSDFLNSALISYKALLKFVERFSVLASDLAKKENDKIRKA
jgi:hypothetical protein